MKLNSINDRLANLISDENAQNKSKRLADSPEGASLVRSEFANLQRSIDEKIAQLNSKHPESLKFRCHHSEIWKIETRFGVNIRIKITQTNNNAVGNASLQYDVLRETGIEPERKEALLRSCSTFRPRIQSDSVVWGDGNGFVSKQNIFDMLFESLFHEIENPSF